MSWLEWGNRNRPSGGGAPVGGLSGPEANQLPRVPRHVLEDLDQEMARRAAMERDRGVSLPQLPGGADDDWGIVWDPIPPAVSAPLSAPRMSGRR